MALIISGGVSFSGVAYTPPPTPNPLSLVQFLLVAGAGAGGSGIAVIRYPDTFALATTTGSPNVIYANANIIYRFWQSGTIIFN